MFEQQIIRDGLKELLTFKSVQSDKYINCASGNITEKENDTTIEESSEYVNDTTIEESSEQVNETSIEESSEQVNETSIEESSEYVNETSIEESSEEVNDTTIEELSEQVNETSNEELSDLVNETSKEESSDLVNETSIEESSEHANETSKEELSDLVNETTLEESSEQVNETTLEESSEHINDTTIKESSEYENDTTLEDSSEQVNETSNEDSSDQVNETSIEESSDHVNKTTIEESSDLVNETTLEESSEYVNETSKEESSEHINETSKEESSDLVNETSIEESSDLINETTLEESSEQVNETSKEDSSEHISETTLEESSEYINETSKEESSEHVNETSIDESSEYVNGTSIEESSEHISETTLESSSEHVNETTLEESSEKVNETVIEESSEHVNETSIEDSSAENVNETTLAESSDHVNETSKEESSQYVNDTVIEESSEQVNETSKEESSEQVNETSKEESSEEVNETSIEESSKEVNETTLEESSEYVNETSIEDLSEHANETTLEESSEYVNETSIEDLSEHANETSIEESSEYVNETSIEESSDHVNETSKEESSEHVNETSIEESSDHVNETSKEESSDHVNETSIEESSDHVNETSIEESSDHVNETSKEESSEHINETSKEESSEHINETSIEESSDHVNETTLEESSEHINETSKEESSDHVNETSKEESSEHINETTLDESSEHVNETTLEESSQQNNDTTIESEETDELISSSNIIDEWESDEADTSKNESDGISSDTKESDSSEEGKEQEKSNILSSDKEEATSDDNGSDTNDEEASSDEILDSTNEENTDELTSTPINSEANDEINIEIQIIEEAEKRANLQISFRQLNQFSFNSGTISFMFYALVTDVMEAGFQIKMNVNLIKITGEREVETIEIPCYLLKNVSPAEGQTLQGDFRCSLSGLTEEYYSLRFNSSGFISGIPEDEILLDPVLTAESISKKEILDFSLVENQKENKIPAIFIPTDIRGEWCRTEGKFIIIGILNKDVSNDVKFTIPLTYPEGISVSCSLDKKERGDCQITCQIDRELDNKKIIFEQVLVKDGTDEILFLKGHSSESEITCLNGLLLESEKRTQIQISFRQVSHLVDNGRNGFSFFFAAFVSQALTAGSTINIKIKILIGQNKIEKTCICTLQRDIEPIDGQQIQGDFQCNVIMEESEYKEINLTNIESVKISSDNEEIAGVSDLEEDQKSPLATDKAISDTIAIKENENITELAECLDYSLEENKENMPPILEISSIENIDECEQKGQFRIIGKFSSNINQEMTFNLPLSFPTASVKCKVYEATADEEVELICKIQKGFKLVNSFVIEKRMIKKRFKEMLLVKSNTFNLGTQSIICENYNTKKYERSRHKQKLSRSFLQLSDFRAQGSSLSFFLGVIRTNNEIINSMTFNVTAKISSDNNLRELDFGQKRDKRKLAKTIPKYIIVICYKNPFNYVEGYKCSDIVFRKSKPESYVSNEIKGTIIGMEIDPDNLEIAGLPDNIDPDVLKNTIDYSKENNLNKLNDLPTVKIHGIESSSCEINGEYTIQGTVEKGTLEDAFDVEIPFGSPDSSGLCDIKVNGKEVTMECKNKEKFDISPILFEQTVIQDSKGMEIFILRNYTNQKSFRCIINVNSESPIKVNNERYNAPIKKTNSNGLSKGAIAAIIICSIIGLAIVAAIIALGKNGTFSSMPPIEQTFGNNSSINNFTTEPKPNE